MNNGSRILLSKQAMRLISIGGLVVLTAVAGLLWYGAASRNVVDEKKDTVVQLPVAAMVCRDDIIQQAAQLIKVHRMLELRSVVETIEKQPNYRNDTNCNYILVSFYTNTGDTAKAQHALDDMLRARNAGSAISLLFDPAVPSSETLQSAIDVQKRLQKQADAERERSVELYNKMDQVQ